jgi:hypothetical protein
MEIHVKNQTAGVITYVDGIQVVHGGLRGSGVTDEDAWRAVHELQNALETVAIDGSRANEARAHVAELGAAVHALRPDKRRAGDILRQLTELLVGTGSLTTAAGALLGPLQTLASWLGAHGAAIFGMLGT